MSSSLRPATRFSVLALSAAVLLAFGASAAQAVPPVNRVFLQAGFNGPVADMTPADANGTRYFVGNFTGWNQWVTGGAGMVDGTSAEVDRQFPAVSGTVAATASDGNGGWYVGGAFTCVGENGDGDCSDSGETPRKNAAHINADGSLDTAWNPQPNGAVNAIAVSGSTVYLAGAFTTVGSSNVTRNRAAAIGTDGSIKSWNPNVNGTVNAIAAQGPAIVLGGSFSTVGGSNRANVAVLSTDGTLSGWTANTDGAVNAIAITSDSTVYLGGTFSTVAGATRSNLAAIANDGSVTSWNPAPNGAVKAIALDGSNVYIGGAFNNIGGVNRGKVASVTTGGTVNSWNPAPNNNVSSIAISGSTVYIGGSFSKIGSSTAYYAGAVGTDGSVKNWAPNPSNEVNSLAINGSQVYIGGIFSSMGGIVRMHALALDSNDQLTSWNPDIYGIPTSIIASNGKFFIGGNFTKVGGATRNNAAAVDSSGSLLSWNPNPNGAINDIVEIGSTLYAGGSFTTIAGGSRSNLAAINEAGALQSWNPGANGAINTMATAGGNIYVGGAFTTAGGSSRNNAAALNTSGGLLSWNPNFNGAVNDIAFNEDGATLYAGGAFTTVGSTTRNRAAEIETDTGNPTSWNPNLNNTVNAVAVAGPDIFLGGTFTTVGSTARNRIAAVFSSGTLSDWNPNANNTVTSISSFGSAIFVSGRFSGMGGNPQSRFWRYNLPVEPTITSSPSGYVASKSGTIEWTGTAGAVYQCSLDGGAWTACTTPYSLTRLGEGPHTFSVRVIDSLGMVAQAGTSANWIVDTIAPVVAITNAPTGIRYGDNENISFSVTEANLDYTECQLDSGEWFGCASGDSITGIGDGPHTLTVRAIDRAGNIGTVTTASWNTILPRVTVDALGQRVHTDAIGTGGSLASIPGNPTPIFVWQRCSTTEASSCVLIQQSRTQRNWYMREADLGQRLRFGVRFYQGTTVRHVWSPMTAKVIPWIKDVAYITTQNNTAAPVKGKLVQFNGGRMEGWNGVVNRTLQWQRCEPTASDVNGLTCTNIPGATGYLYRVTAADVGKELRTMYFLEANVNHYLEPFTCGGASYRSGVTTAS